KSSDGKWIILGTDGLARVRFKIDDDVGELDSTFLMPDPASSVAVSSATRAKLDFLADVPEFRDFDRNMTAEQVKTIVAREGLLLRAEQQGLGGTSFHIYRRDGANVIVMYRDDGSFGGIQRMVRDPQTASMLAREADAAAATQHVEPRLQFRFV